MALEKPLRTRQTKRPRKPAAYPDGHIILRVFDLVHGNSGSCEEVCKRAGVSKDYLTGVRRGDRSPSILHIEALLNCIGYELTIRRKRDREK